VQPADVLELIAAGAQVIVLSCGMLNRLKTQPDTQALLEARGIACHDLQTPRAVAVYNDLREQRKVGALIHSTC
jgi:hypothetical protein